VVVDDRYAWQRLLKEASPLVLIATDADFADDVTPDVQHTVVVPVPQSENADVVLEPTDSERVAEALRSLIERSWYELGALSRRSFVSFRRRIARRPELMTPPWAVGSLPRPVRAALLVVEWSDANKADRDVVAALAAMPYEAVREELLRYTAGDDPLLALTTDRWLLVSPADAWQQLGRHLLADDLHAFVEQASLVLGERDPALDLAKAERWRASIDQKVFQHSHALRRHRHRPGAAGYVRRPCRRCDRCPRGALGGARAASPVGDVQPRSVRRPTGEPCGRAAAPGRSGAE
jgi:hypothetical protein